MTRKAKELRVLVLVHEDLVPPETIAGLSKEEIAPFKTEYDVTAGLQALGHHVQVLGLHDELSPLRGAIKAWDPDIVWNLLEEFRDQAVYDQNLVSYLELKGVPYTGCNPRGLIITRDKALSKKILHYHRIRVPRFVVFRRGRRARRTSKLEFPLIVKSLVEEASLGISQASVVSTDEKLAERVAFIHEHIGTDAIVEQYVAGRDVYAPVLGNDRLTILPIWELFMDELPAEAERIATHKVKWDLAYQKRHGIRLGPAPGLSDELTRELQRLSRRIYRVLGMGGYGRLDFRLSTDNKLYFLEANPNADIGSDEEFASAGKAAGIEYPQLLQRILNLGLRQMQKRHGADS